MNPMLFSDVTFSTEGIVLITGLLATLVGAVSVIFKLLIASKDAQIASAVSDRNSYKGMYDDAMVALEIGINSKRRAEGKPPIQMLPPVVPEHNSEPTAVQQTTAVIATDRARLTAMVADLGLVPRQVANFVSAQNATG